MAKPIQFSLRLGIDGVFRRGETAIPAQWTIVIHQSRKAFHDFYAKAWPNDWARNPQRQGVGTVLAVYDPNVHRLHFSRTDFCTFLVVHECVHALEDYRRRARRTSEECLAYGVQHLAKRIVRRAALRGVRVVRPV